MSSGFCVTRIVFTNSSGQITRQPDGITIIGPAVQDVNMIPLHLPPFDNVFRKSCAPEGSRTPNPQLRRLMLYPVELLARGKRA